MKPRFFATPGDFRAWLARHHETAGELLVGFYKRASGRPSITWPESVDEALCFGWIDGVRRSIDDQSYSIRFTPRRKGSIWSAVNIERARALQRLGRMAVAGLAAFEVRRDDRSAIYSYERRRTAELPPEMRKALEANARARKDFEARPPWYRRATAHWVVSAKKEKTRQQRLATLIDCSVRGVPVPPLVPSKGTRNGRRGRGLVTS